MTSEELTVTCPNCSTVFPLTDALRNELNSELKSVFEKKLQAELDKVKAKEEGILEATRKLETEKQQFDETLTTALKEKEKALINKITKEETEKVKEQIELLKESNNKLQSNADEHHKEKLRVLELEGQLKDQKRVLELELQKQLQSVKSLALEEGKKEARQEADLKLKEKEKTINDLTEALTEVTRRAEQGSINTQGEVLEISLRDLLKEEFKNDVIEDVPPGVLGADIQMKVLNSSGTTCGTILFEIKRTKSFNDVWLTKLRDDGIRAEADLLVLVTEVLPTSELTVSFRDGIWITNIQNVRWLILCLRFQLIRVHQEIQIHSNKAEKAERLYEYLAGDLFVQQIQSILQGFNDIRSSYESEKRALQRIWKTRDKQIEKILETADSFIGTVVGISGGNTTALSKLLLLPDNSLEIDEDGYVKIDDWKQLSVGDNLKVYFEQHEDYYKGYIVSINAMKAGLKITVEYEDGEKSSLVSEDNTWVGRLPSVGN